MLSVILPTRRRLLASLVTLVAAPAVVRASSLMAIAPVPLDLPMPPGRSWPDKRALEYVYRVVFTGDTANFTDAALLSGNSTVEWVNGGGQSQFVLVPGPQRD